MSDRHDAAPEPEPAAQELFVEFANTAELSTEGAPDGEGDAARLADWLLEHGLIDAPPGRGRLDRQVPAFRELRSLVRSVAERLDRGQSPTRGQVAAINRAMRDGLHYHALRAADAGSGVNFTMRPVGDELDQARSAVAGSLAHYLAEHDHDRLRLCASETCRWLFVDRSPSGRRRWCDMRVCGNRAKVRRHRARAQGAPA
jgi:predicted RNA-binding Zn ribbon-like protein